MSFIDKLAYDEPEVEQDGLLPDNASAELFMSRLYSYEPYVDMIMKQAGTGKIDIDLFKTVAMYMFRACQGTIDIKQTCYLIIATFDDIEAAWSEVGPATTLLIKKHDEP